MVSLKSLILNARLNPDAKNPPNGAMMLANEANTTACTWNHDTRTVSRPNKALATVATHPCGTIQPSADSNPPTMDPTVTSFATNKGSTSHPLAPPNRRSGDLSSTGQISHSYFCIHAAAKGATIRVTMRPPMNPSHVFFGDILISGVRPKKKPHMYAAASLKNTIDTGNTNQIMPSRTFATKHELCISIVTMIMCVHANCPNW
mmetsp:Transcript_11271/g.45519  ORF Transcript_11271/g.45519 Transcript_11271/m.45519 type:complete len:204 (+) Transcript_11271:307-918(+)